MKIFCSLVVGILGSVAASTAFAEMVTKTVDYELDGVKMKGYLAYDSSITPDAKKPGVLVIPEWWGLTPYIEKRTREVAELGYVAFAADMYGNGKTTFDAKEAAKLSGPFYGKPLMAARARAAYDALLKTGLVPESKVGAMGFCFGGSSVMALAATGVPLVGAVTFHGGPVPPTPEQAAKLKTPLLVLNGADDPMVTADKLQELVKAWSAGGAKIKVVNYPGALHAFTNPDADKLAVKNDMVGKIGYNEFAATKSWAAMKAFFKNKFAN